MTHSDVIRLFSEFVSINTVNDPASDIKQRKECVRFIQEELDQTGVQ
jgi:acetylornithine deacetylase/succinyl-diaminopimelate desuccinylase-like protein